MIGETEDATGRSETGRRSQLIQVRAHVSTTQHNYKGTRREVNRSVSQYKFVNQGSLVHYRLHGESPWSDVSGGSSNLHYTRESKTFSRPLLKKVLEHLGERLQTGTMQIGRFVLSARGIADR